VEIPISEPEASAEAEPGAIKEKELMK